MTASSAPLRIEIIDPLSESEPQRSVDSVGVAVEAVPFTDYGAELAAAARAWTAEKSAPIARAGTAAHNRGSRLAHIVGRRRDQVMSDGNPRRDSRVKQHLFVTFAEIESRLPREAVVLQAGRGELVTTTEFRRRQKGGVQAEGTLRLPWSWPAIPVSITVEPWWRSQTIATIEIRNRRRWRYPRRYFRSAHSAARDLRARTMRPS